MHADGDRDNQDGGDLGEQSHGLKVLLRVDTQVLKERGVDGNRTKRRHQQGVTIWGGSAHDLGPQIAGGACLVLNHNAHPPSLSQLIGHLSCQDVGSAPSCKGDNHFDGLVRKVLCLCKHGEQTGTKKRKTYHFPLEATPCVKPSS